MKGSARRRTTLMSAQEERRRSCQMPLRALSASRCAAFHYLLRLCRGCQKYHARHCVWAGKKKTQLETNIKFLFLSDTKLISLHLGIDKPAAKQGEKKKKKTGKKRAFLVDK